MVRQTERGRQIPWLHGCCGILGLVERSSSPGHVCFGRLCEGEICSSSLPAFALLQQQTIQWGATAALSHAMSPQLLSPAAANSSSQSQLLSDYHCRAQQSESLWFCDNDFIFFPHRASPEIIISQLTTYRNVNEISLLCNNVLTQRWVAVVIFDTDWVDTCLSDTQDMNRNKQACDKFVKLIADNMTGASAPNQQKKDINITALQRLTVTLTEDSFWSKPDHKCTKENPLLWSPLFLWS